jgi:hypothetical protein
MDATQTSMSENTHQEHRIENVNKSAVAPFTCRPPLRNEQHFEIGTRRKYIIEEQMLYLLAGRRYVMNNTLFVREENIHKKRSKKYMHYSLAGRRFAMNNTSKLAPTVPALVSQNTFRCCFCVKRVEKSRWSRIPCGITT